jgi:hypothetical protein
MNLRTTFVLIVMALAVLSAWFTAPPDETVLMASTQDESSGAATARTGWR